MNQATQNRQKGQADAFEILARSLPEMIRARATNPRILPKTPDQMGGITKNVAIHLGVEICSIFLLEVDADTPRLVLAEAYGYDDAAVGQPKWLNQGLTPMIAGLTTPNPKGPTEIICNFTVQDHEGWTGQLDKELRGHGWTLLGIPIVGANGKSKGVIKLENKKSVSHSDEVSTFLGATASLKNTPGEIAGVAHSLTKQARSMLGADSCSQPKSDWPNRLLKLLEEIDRIAENLLDACKQLSCDIPFGTEAKEQTMPSDLLAEHLQEKLMAALQLQTAALLESLKYLHDSQLIKDSAFADSLAMMRNMTASLDLALRAYTPFARNDVLLVRAVAALIAAAIDISENTGEVALHQLQHGLKGETVEFLMLLYQLTTTTKQLWKQNDDVRTPLKELWLTGLNISGPQDAIGPKVSRSSFMGTTIGRLLHDDLDNRLYFYRDCAEVWGKVLLSPKNSEISTLDLNTLYLPCPTSLILGVCDILFCNAAKHGGTHIEIRFEIQAHCFLIVFADNGRGIPQDKLKDLEESTSLLSGGARFGLRAAKQALEQYKLRLRVLCNGSSGDNMFTEIAIEIPLKT